MHGQQNVKKKKNVPGGQYSYTKNSTTQSQKWLPCPTNQNRHGGKEMRERKIYA